MPQPFNGSQSKNLNINAQEFSYNKKKSSQSNSNTLIYNEVYEDIDQGNGSQQQWVPQKKETQMVWKRKDETKDIKNPPQFDKTNSYQVQDQRHDREYKQGKKQQRQQQSFKNNNDDDINLMSLQKQVSHHNASASTLLGFYYQDEDSLQGGSYSNSYNSKSRRRGQKGYRYHKPYNIQSAFKFIVKSNNDYMLNLYDPNENIEWKDVIQVIFNMTNAEDVKCPICLEPLQQMVVPRITKCGHIYCWPCVLQYLAFEKSKAWKRCALCNESIYKHELKSVKVVQSLDYKEGSMITFHLMVRNKANIIVKDKFIAQDKEHSKQMPTTKFPNELQKEYQQTRVIRNEISVERKEFNREIQILEQEQQVLRSSQEFEKIPNVLEAIEHCQKELVKLNNPNQNEEQDIVDFEEKKRRHNKKQTLKHKQPSVEEIEENNNDFYYFYQSSTGENLFLHPLCMKILQYEYDSYSKFPLQIEGQILEINNELVDQDDKEFAKYQYLNHLPDGAPYGFVEIDMAEIVSDEVFRDFEKQIGYRHKHRQRKIHREETYAGKVQNIQNEKFEQIKREAINSININSVFLKPGVVRHYTFDEADEESKEEEEEKQESQEQEETKEQQPLTAEQKLWSELGDLMSKDQKTAQALRKDTLEGVELSIAAKKAKEAAKKKEEKELAEEFTMASGIIVIEGKGPKRKKKRR